MGCALSACDIGNVVSGRSLASPGAPTNSLASASHPRFRLNCSAGHGENLSTCDLVFAGSRGASSGRHRSARSRPNSCDASYSSISFRRLSGSVLSGNAAARSAVGLRPAISRFARRRNSAAAAKQPGASTKPWPYEDLLWAPLNSKEFLFNH